MDVLAYIVGRPRGERCGDCVCDGSVPLHELERNLGITGQICIGSVVERWTSCRCRKKKLKTVFKNWMINSQRRIASNADLYMEQRP